MSDTRNPDRAIARIARSQHGLVTRAQARDAGLSPGAIRHRLDSGTLVAAGRGVYTTPVRAADLERAALAACLQLGGCAVLSHRSAAGVWRLDLPAHPRIELTVPYAEHAPPSAPVTVHRSRSLPPCDRTIVGGLPVTALARTLVDLAAVLDRTRLAVVIDDALARRLLTPACLARTVDRLARGRRPGAHTLRRIVVEWSGGPALESAAEAAFRRAIHDGGLPAPVAQYQPHVEGLPRTRLDFAWPEHMVALEVDSFRWHADPTSHAANSVRSNILVAAGWRVLHATPTELTTNRETVLLALRQALFPPDL